MHVQYREMNRNQIGKSSSDAMVTLAPPPVNLPSNYPSGPQRIPVRHYSLPVTPAPGAGNYIKPTQQQTWRSSSFRPFYSPPSVASSPNSYRHSSSKVNSPVSFRQSPQSVASSSNSSKVFSTWGSRKTSFDSATTLNSNNSYKKSETLSKSNYYNTNRTYNHLGGCKADINKTRNERIHDPVPKPIIKKSEKSTGSNIAAATTIDGKKEQVIPRIFVPRSADSIAFYQGYYPANTSAPPSAMPMIGALPATGYFPAASYYSYDAMANWQLCYPSYCYGFYGNAFNNTTVISTKPKSK